MPRLLVLLLCLVGSFPAAAPAADTAAEPGLTSRIATLALVTLPPEVTSRLPGSGVSILERLQSLPQISSDNASEQLVAIFGQVRDHVASPDLLASAARCAVALSLAGETSEAWSDFKSAVALRSASSELELPTSRRSVEDAAAYASALRASAEAVRTQVLAASQASDGIKLATLRKRTASSAVAAVSDVWTALLAIQSPKAEATAEAAGPVVAVQPERPSASVGSASATRADKKPAKVSAVNPATGMVICNKDSKKFHRDGCRFLPALPNQVRMPNRQQAMLQGFEPCKVCRP